MGDILAVPSPGPADVPKNFDQNNGITLISCLSGSYDYLVTLHNPVEMELEAPVSSNRIIGHALLSAGTRSGVTIVL